MKKELKDQWIADLESGIFKQTIGMLRTRDNKFCCLGVLCNRIDPTKWTQLPGGSFRFESNGGSLPMTVKESIGFNCDDEAKLIQLNDQDRKTFPEIAQWVRENIKETV